MSTETRNPYFEAVEARTEEWADRWFGLLLNDVMRGDPKLANDSDNAKERVVASLLYVAGYYGPDAQERVTELYSWRSPYRRAGILQRNFRS